MARARAGRDDPAREGEVVTSWPRHRSVARVLVAIIVVGLTSVALPAQADGYGLQRRDAEARAAQAAQSAAVIATTIGGLTARLTQAADDLHATQARLPVAQTELAAAQQAAERSHRAANLVASRLQDAQALQVNVATTIASDAAHTAQVAASVGQIAREAYKGQTAATGLAVALGAKSSQDFVDQYTMVSTALRIQSDTLATELQVAASDRNDQARSVAVTNRIAALKVEADTHAAQAEIAKADAAARQAEIAQLIVDQIAAQAAVAALRAQAEAEQVQIDAQRAAIGVELAGIITAQRAAQASSAPAATGQAVTCFSGSAAGAAGPAPGTTLPASIGPFRGEQIINAAQIIIAGNDLGVDAHGQVLAVMTAIGESTLIAVDHGDAAGPDSRGLFQQRANGAWGSYSDRMDPRTAATSFFRALLQVPGWESMAPTLAAHRVQSNADPSYYTPYFSAAVQLVAALGGDPSLTCR